MTINFSTRQVTCLTPQGESYKGIKLFVTTEHPNPQELLTLTPPALDPRTGLVISGDMPDWLSGFLARYYTNYWIAISQSNTSAVVFGGREKIPPSKTIQIGTQITIFTPQAQPAPTPIVTPAPAQPEEPTAIEDEADDEDTAEEYAYA